MVRVFPRSFEHGETVGAYKAAAANMTGEFVEDLPLSGLIRGSGPEWNSLDNLGFRTGVWNKGSALL